MYIALDLETTGFDALADQIIEIAAIKFDGEKVIDRFETLVNPEVPIPAMITHITGIKAANLVDAPKMADIQKQLMTFLGNYPIVGHNISFDVTFLQQKGLPIVNELYDTLQMATILMPGLPSYSLDTLSRLLKITHTQKHRAMSDTEASRQLFLMLEQKITEINPHIYAEIAQILNKSSWSLRNLFLQKGKDLKPKKVSEKNKLRKITPAKTENEKNKETTATEKTAHLNLFDFYDAKGTLAAVMPDYEHRPAQQQMSAHILEAFEKGHNALIEAGTGSGKTIAYGISSALWSLKHSHKVVISTYTHQLQQQLLEKDLPIITAALNKLSPTTTENFTIAVLKGRRNYLSTKRLQVFKTKNFYQDHEVTFLMKVLLWMESSHSGDLSEITLQGKEFALLDEICCAEHVCPHEDLEFKSGCYLMKARQKAEKANLIIVNHALLIQNEITDTPLLPEYQLLIIDEAHHLESVATDALTITIALNAFLKPFNKLEELLKNLGGETLASLKHKTASLIGRIEIFFGLLGIFLEKHLDPFNFQYQLTLLKNELESAEWQKAISSAKSILELGLQITSNIAEQEDNFKNSIGNLWIAEHPLWTEIKGALYQAERVLGDLQTILSADSGAPLAGQNGQQISWIFKSYAESISLKSAPLNIGATLQQILFGKRKSVILTSATLRTDHSFAYIRDQLGLNKSFEEFTLPSHFAYPDQVKILIAEDLPEPNTEGYFMSCAKLIAKIIKKNQGRTLALFTSKKALAATYHQIAPQLKEDGFTVLAQNVTGGRGKILEHFKDEPQNCAILGTASFWEGVDIKGDALTCVVMQKLPFDPPDDPIIAARSKKYTNAFNQYQLPRAILRFKQGFGRLIRSSKDTGSIVILDTRIVQKSYGHEFLESLPEGIKIKYSSQEKLADLL